MSPGVDQDELESVAHLADEATVAPGLAAAASTVLEDDSRAAAFQFVVDAGAVRRNSERHVESSELIAISC